MVFHICTTQPIYSLKPPGKLGRLDSSPSLVAGRLRGTWFLYFPWRPSNHHTSLRWSLVPCQPLWLPRDTDQDCTTQSSVCYTQQLPHPYPCPHRHLETSEKGTERTLEKALELLSRDSKGEDCVHTQPCPEHSQGLWPKSNHVMDLITQCAMFCLLALVTMLVLSKGCHYQIPEASWNQRQGFNKAEGGTDGMKEEGTYRKREGRRERRTGGAKQSDHSINIQWDNQA